MSVTGTPDSKQGVAPPEPRLGRIRLDADGRMIPMTKAELAAHIEARKAASRRAEAIPDDDNPVDDAEVMRAIDSHRPHRPLFEGLY